MNIQLIMEQRKGVRQVEETLKKEQRELLKLENAYVRRFYAGELVFFYMEDEKEKPVKFLITGINYVYYLDDPQYVITGIFQDGKNSNQPFEVRDITALVKFEDSTF